MVPTKRSPLPCIKQPAQTSGSKYLPVGRHPSRPSEKPRLHPVDDQQQDSRRMAQKSNFSELGKSPIQASVRIKAAWKQATLFLSLGIKCYSQWFEGERNQVSDALSYDKDRSDEDCTNAIKSFCPSQAPSHFEILQLPKEITLWLTVLLLKLPVSMQLREDHMRSNIGRGSSGRNTAIQLESRAISPSKTSPKNTDTSSLMHLPWLSGNQGF